MVQFVSFRGSHLATEEEAAKALGDLIVDPKFSNVSGSYFDGFKEIPSSVESRDEGKVWAVWEQSAKLAGLSRAGQSAKRFSTARQRGVLQHVTRLFRFW
jgi:hypothetical protein